MSSRISQEAVKSAVSSVECFGQILERRAVTGNDPLHRQASKPVQSLPNIVERFPTFRAGPCRGTSVVLRPSDRPCRPRPPAVDQAVELDLQRVIAAAVVGILVRVDDAIESTIASALRTRASVWAASVQ